MNILKIQAVDTLFFRDGKPFSMGDETAIDTKTVPFPSVFWGAIFSRLIADGKIKQDKQDKYDKRVLKIGRVFLYNEQNSILLLPAPADIFKDKDGNIYTEKYEMINEKVAVSSNITTQYLVMPNTDEDVKRVENSFIEINSFKPYIEQLDSDISIYEITDIIEYENKVGIKRNSSNTTEEGNLYRIPMLRFKENWNYLVEYELQGGIDLGNQGVLKLGGEGKTAKYSKFNKKIGELSESRTVENDEFLKIYASSHLIFKENISNWKEIFDEKFPDCTLWSVANSIHVAVGGWDMETNKPKIMKRALPAGSVFMLKFNGEKLNSETIKERFSELLSSEETRFGFNQFEILI